MRWPLTLRKTTERALELCREATDSTKAALALVERLAAENAVLRQKFTVNVRFADPAADLATMTPASELAQ